MSEEITSKSREFVGLVLNLLKVIGAICTIVIISQVWIVMFGNSSEADKAMLKDTEKAQVNIKNALLLVYDDYGRLEVRSDYSVHAYIPKKNYMSVPYPDRNVAIDLVGKAWCENKGVNLWYMPKVILRDIQTGETFDSYRCLSEFIRKK